MDALLEILAPTFLSLLTVAAAVAIAWLRKRLQVEDAVFREHVDDLVDRTAERRVRAVEQEGKTREKTGQSKIPSTEKQARAENGTMDDLKAIGGKVGKVALQMAAQSLPGRIGSIVGKLF